MRPCELFYALTQDSNLIWFSYLKHLDVPQKYKITHRIIEKLIQIDLDRVEEDGWLEYSDIIDHQELNPAQLELEETLKNLSTKEAAFQIAQTEYENKESRFVKLTNYTRQSLDQLYAERDLLFRDIKEDKILQAIQTRNINKIIQKLKETVTIISRDVDTAYSRKDLLVQKWEELSKDQMKKIQSFEYRGLKEVSTNLRVKLIPIIEELKTELGKPSLVEESLSRVNIELQINDMVEKAREDIYGDLTPEQVELLKEINPDLTTGELIKMMDDEHIRENLIVLLETNKIDITMKKVIDRLI